MKIVSTGNVPLEVHRAIFCVQVRDGDQVMVCLKRALKIAHAAQQQLAIALRQSDTLPAALFVEILNHYLYYFDQGLTLITSTVLQVGTWLCMLVYQ